MAGICVRKIVWSVDPFEQGQTVRKNTAQTLSGFVEPLQAEVEPVYILNLEGLNSEGSGGLEWIAQCRPAAEKSLRNAMKECGVPGLKPPKVLVQAEDSTTAAVQALAKYAAEAAADLIVVGTHGRKGVPRLFLGSFAETLLMYSKVPVLVVNPKAKGIKKYRKILFATDLSRQSWGAFRKVMALARDLEAGVILYHSMQSPSVEVFPWLPAGTYLEGEIIKRRKTAERWVAAAGKLGVKTEFVAEAGKKGVVQAIVAAAEKQGASMIALAAQSGPVASVVIGSVTRQVVREAEVPVWVIRAPAEKGG